MATLTWLGCIATLTIAVQTALAGTAFATTSQALEEGSLIGDRSVLEVKPSTTTSIVSAQTLIDSTSLVAYKPGKKIGKPKGPTTGTGTR